MTLVLKQKKLLTYDVLVNTVWVSTLLAVLLVLPSIGIFVYSLTTTSDLIISVVLAFGVHFLVLSFSERISKVLLQFSLFDNEVDIHFNAFLPNDYLTFETDELEIKVLTSPNKGKKQVQVFSHLLEYQLFHHLIHKEEKFVSTQIY